MRTSLLVISLTAVALATNAAGQATVETLMTHSVSTAVGTHVGTALGNATNALANRVANRTSATTRTGVVSHQTVSRRAARAPQAANGFASTQAPPQSGNGSMIASIQGGEKPPGCAANSKPAGANGSQAAPQSCGFSLGAASHPSVVNLPAPK